MIVLLSGWNVVTATGTAAVAWVRRRTTDDGLVRIEVLLPPEEAEIVMKAA